MKHGQDIAAEFPGVVIIHHKIRDLSLDEHRHHQHEIFLPLQGEIRVRLGKGRLRAGPGKMIYLPPDTDHAFESAVSGQGERLILLVEKSAWNAHGCVKGEAKVTEASVLAKELLFHLLIFPRTQAVKALLETLLLILSETLEASFGREDLKHLTARASDERVTKAVEFIQENFRDPISAGEIARHSGMSSRTLNRLFLSELSVTPKQLVALHRIDEGKRLLINRSASVTDVAFEVGYGSVSQFIHNFRKITGKLPSDRN